MRESEKKQAQRRYRAELGGALLSYTGAIFGSISFLNGNPDSEFRFFVAVIPVLPTLLALWAIIRHVRRFDELYRHIFSEALAYAAIVTALATFTYGLMENAGLPHLPILWTLPVMIGLWGVILPFVRRKYQ